MIFTPNKCILMSTYKFYCIYILCVNLVARPYALCYCFIHHSHKEWWQQTILTIPHLNIWVYNSNPQTPLDLYPSKFLENTTRGVYHSLHAILPEPLVLTIFWFQTNRRITDFSNAVAIPLTMMVSTMSRNTGYIG